SSILQGAEKRLAEVLEAPPVLHLQYQKLKARYLADFMPGAAGLREVTNGVALLLEAHYETPPYGIPLVARDLMIFLHLVHEMTEWAISLPGELMTPNINKEIAAFIVQAVAYYGLTAEEKEQLKAYASVLDGQETGVQRRYGPVFQFMDRFNAET